MQIISKSEALKILRVTPGAKKRTFSAGKYVWKGSQDAYIGKEVGGAGTTDCLAVFVERRQDRDGPFAQLMCICIDGDK